MGAGLVGNLEGRRCSIWHITKLYIPAVKKWCGLGSGYIATVVAEGGLRCTVEAAAKVQGLVLSSADVLVCV